MKQNLKQKMKKSTGTLGLAVLVVLAGICFGRADGTVHPAATGFREASVENDAENVQFQSKIYGNDAIVTVKTFVENASVTIPDEMSGYPVKKVILDTLYPIRRVDLSKHVEAEKRLEKNRRVRYNENVKERWQPLI